MSVALLMLAGCSKEKADTQIEEQTSDIVYVFNFDEESQDWEMSTIDEPQNDSGVILERGNNGNSAHAHGDFFNQEFSGTENNGGTHGSATLALGPWVFTCETECVMVEGNEAVYGGTITEVAGPPPPPFLPFNVGNHIYFKVIDNGQGNNAPADQLYGGGISFTGNNSKCGDWTPSHPRWLESPYIDIAEPGSIKVNN